MKPGNILLGSLLIPLLVSCASTPKPREQRLWPKSELYQDHTFIALQYDWVLWSRRVKVYVLKDRLSVAKIGGGLDSPVFVSDPWYMPKFYVDHSYQVKYIGVDPSSEEFLSIDKANYRIKQSDIVNVEYDPTNKWGMGAVPHSGKIWITTTNGHVHEFVLLGSQNGDLVKNMIEQILELQGR